MLTGLCSEEELIRNLYYSARLHREHGVPFESFTLTDAPSHVWTIPTILAGAGIKYVSVGINGIRAPLLKQNIHHKSPFWWEGPDGSKVLTWFTAGYSQAGQIGLNEGMRAHARRPSSATSTGGTAARTTPTTPSCCTGPTATTWPSAGPSPSRSPSTASITPIPR